MRTKSGPDNPIDRAERTRALLPSIAAALACVAVTPVTNLGVDLWLGRSTRVAEDSGSKLDVQPVSHRNEPILPVPQPVGLNQDWVALGRALFHEPGLSSAGSVACATCHCIEKGGDDGLRVPEGVNGQSGAINSPTVLNAALNFRQYWDGRAATLEEQIPGPIHNPIEMGADWDHVLAFLHDTPGYRDWFEGVFDDGITIQNVIDAVAEYERALVTPDSDFDRWLKGDDDALTVLQKEGYRHFKENHCIGCHQGVNVGGNLYEPLGVMVQYFEDSDRSVQHLGRFSVTGDENDLHVFKVPGLRNVAKTAPYFHDGSAASLDAAVRVMLTHQLGMPEDESTVLAICAFLESLTAEPVERRP